MSREVVWPLILPIRGYRLILSPWLDHSCRFQTSCFTYAIEALETRGALLGLWPVLCCSHLWGGFGYDLVAAAAIRRRVK